MLRRTSIAAALVALTAGVSPAVAAHQDWAGFTCGFEETSRASRAGTTGVTGTMEMGWWIAGEVLDESTTVVSTRAGISHIVYHCHVQVNDGLAHLPGTAAHDTTSALATHVRGDGFVHREQQVRFTFPTGADLYLCTYVEMTHDGEREIYVYDEDDDASNGLQCAVLP